MLSELKLIHVLVESDQPCEIPLKELQSTQGYYNPFILRTCQRLVFISFDQSTTNTFMNTLNTAKINDYEILEGHEAYRMLLQIICGLKSKLTAEHEIVHQFKLAYLDYIQSQNKDSKLLQLLEKLFKDAKTIRSKYLQGLGQKTYSGLVRKILLKNYNAKKVLILGSGALATDLINQLKGKLEVFIAARNTQKVQELVTEHNIRSISWENLNDIANYSFIINTIGTNISLFDMDFYLQWTDKHQSSAKLFIDFGSPSPLAEEIRKKKDIFKLDEIFEQGKNIDQNKIKQVNIAFEEIDSLAYQRHLYFSQNLLKNNKSSLSF